MPSPQRHSRWWWGRPHSPQSTPPSALLLILLLSALILNAAEHRGKVQFGGLPVPGATVTATQGDRTLVAITDMQGNYVFPDLPDGVWNFQIEMQAFAPIKQEVTITAGKGAPEWDLKLLSLDEIKATAAPPPPPPPSRPKISVTQPAETPATTVATNSKNKNKKGAAKSAQAATPANQQNAFQRAAVNANPNAAPPASQSTAAEAVPTNSAFAGQSASDLSQRASDGLLINGTVNNRASSPFAQNARFGNNIRGIGGLYNGSIALIEDNSALDANSFSYTGQPTPKPEYDHLQAAATFGGPIRIPHLIRDGPFFFVAYQLIRNHNAQTNSYLMPPALQPNGDYVATTPIYDPAAGAYFPNNTIPASRINPVALNLLKYYPQPNLAGSSLYNFQIPIVGETHQDNLQTRLNKNIGNRNSLYGLFALQRQATDSPNEFAFLDKTNTLGLNAQANWQHRFSQRMFAHFQVQFTRYSVDTTPFFANRENVSKMAGITGNDQDPANYGPPTLTFASGIASLTDGIAADNHNQTIAYAFDSLWVYGRHSITYGADFKRLQFNFLSQQDPRGIFTFTGAYTAPPSTGSGIPELGSAFADFLLGVPDTSQIAFGNADKYFRESQYDAFITDDWRIGPSLTLNTGVRWEYAAPITELYGRLVDLDIAPGFSADVPVVASNPTGLLTGIKYPDSLLQPDKTGFQPRIGLAWRPLPASSLVVRAGYGVYYNTSVYQTIASQIAQQAPLSNSSIFIQHRRESALDCKLQSASRATLLPSIPTSASATRKTGRYPRNAICLGHSS